ncbi:ASCH domain-containing protein [Evansella halocellulosilytica]|uniref:ASCH domain-containing protein n=1 Tax=Evansella halocellulosilytica TaxID=2011013 RepID=UPI000BB8D069|nr:ASCH domain-containing protein [Evansella halocellulosilytica]
MNEAAKAYWNDYWKDQKMPGHVSAWQFGADPDQLAQLVIDGIKTATCSAYVFYEKENEPLPKNDEYSIILNRKDEPAAIIKNVEVSVIPMNEVSEEFAVAEGEGDRTYRYWWDVHEQFFRSELRKLGVEFSEDMLLVCERFELIDVKRKE